MHSENNLRPSLTWSEPRRDQSGCEASRGASWPFPSPRQSKSSFSMPRRERGRGHSNRGPQVPRQHPGVSAPQSRANKYIAFHSARRTRVWADILAVWFSAESEDKGHRVGSRGKAPAPGVLPGSFGKGRDGAPVSGGGHDLWETRP